MNSTTVYMFACRCKKPIFTNFTFFNLLIDQVILREPSDRKSNGKKVEINFKLADSIIPLLYLVSTNAISVYDYRQRDPRDECNT